MSRQSHCYDKRKLASTAQMARHNDQCIESFGESEVVSNGLPPPLPSVVCDGDVEVEVTAVVVEVDD